MLSLGMGAQAQVEGGHFGMISYRDLVWRAVLVNVRKIGAVVRRRMEGIEGLGGAEDIIRYLTRNRRQPAAWGSERGDPAPS